MFNPNAPHRRPSHSLNTPVPILIDSDEEISDAEHESENESGSENDSMQVDEYPQREMGNYSILSSSFSILSISHSTILPNCQRTKLIDNQIKT
ncbi:hypothetical protein BDW42DRAFT_161682 [Aspergillus taichungensis]|uniref:Uncharacterized protein n=1 Tax=Aspergillus taichungensis TaxID=482145 RepID=A0A2J5I4H7_9EURO|nr:hypothetical protein BDW42DRAFT_161682 [Aspergillus taichungensis]